MIKPRKKKKSGSVLVLGGGIAGIQSALDLGNSGFKVYLVEESPVIGGNMARLDKTFPTNDCSMCILSPKLVEVGRHRNIELITLGEIKYLTGRAGNFQARIRRSARYVDLEKCTGCGDCLEKCPTRYRPRFKIIEEKISLTENEKNLVKSLVNKYRESPAALMRVLQEVNACLRYLPKSIIYYLAEEFSVPASVIFRIGTFYTAFSLTPRGRHTASVCTGTACHIKGAPRLLDELKRELQINVGDTTSDFTFSLETVRCLGCCSLAPVVKIDERVYGGLKPGEMPKILKDYRK
jgi:NADH:ubiquinone oxidoreductase subunit E